MLTLSQILVLLLIVIAFTVVVGLICKKNMWPLIIVYWIVLTCKNVADFMHW